MATPPRAILISPRPLRRADLALMLALVLLTLTTFAPVVRCKFLNYDDDLYVIKNMRVLTGLSGQNITWAFRLGPGHAANYHPLTWLSLMIDSQIVNSAAEANLSIAALSDPPLVFHLHNLLLHALNVLLVFLVLRAMTADRWRSALVAVLFAVHPLRVESVAWVSERKDVLSAAWGLLALLAYIRYTWTLKRRTYGLSLVLFVLSLLAKPMLVTAPFLLLLLDYWPLRRTALQGRRAEPGPAPLPTASNPEPQRLGRLLLEKVPFVVLAAAMSVLTFAAQREGGAVRTTGQVSLAARLANIPVAYVRYLANMVRFNRLAVDYPYPPSWPPHLVVGCVLILAGFTTVVLWQLRRRPWLAVGWFWYLGMLVPVIGLVQVGDQSLADRYTYLPMLGVLIMLAWSIPTAAFQRVAGRIGAGVATLAILGVLIGATRVQLRYWRDSVTLMQRAVEVNPGNFLAQTDLAAALGSPPAGEAPDKEGAAEHYGMAAALRPRSATARNNYGLALGLLGKTREAAAEYEAALKLDPRLPEAHNNLGLLLATERHDLKGAAAHYRQALEARPRYADAHNNLGLALAEMGDLRGAMVEYEAALQIDADHLDARLNLAAALEQAGRRGTALDQLREAVRRRPGDPRAQEALGRMQARAAADTQPR